MISDITKGGERLQLIDNKPSEEVFKLCKTLVKAFFGFQKEAQTQLILAQAANTGLNRADF